MSEDSPLFLRCPGCDSLFPDDLRQHWEANSQCQPTGDVEVNQHTAVRRARAFTRWQTLSQRVLEDNAWYTPEVQALLSYLSIVIIPSDSRPSVPAAQESSSQNFLLARPILYAQSLQPTPEFMSEEFKTELYDLAIETACPAVAEFRIFDELLRLNMKWTHMMALGTLFEKKYNRLIYRSGSQAAGLTLEKGWGQEESDRDDMYFLKGPWRVALQEPQNDKPCLIMDASSHVRAGYCRLLVKGNSVELASLLAERCRWWSVPSRLFGTDDAGNVLLSSSEALKCIRGVKEDDVHGPAETVPGRLWDRVPALLCSGPLPWVETFLARLRPGGWFNIHTLWLIKRLPGTLVATGHTSSEQKHLEWRVSCSVQEHLLINDMPPWAKQGFLAFKYCIKSQYFHLSYTKKINGGTSVTDVGHGRSSLQSYHMVTTLLWELEKANPSKSPYILFRALVSSVRKYLEEKHLPHYFISGCNLFESMSEEARLHALSLLEEINTNPLHNILNIPTIPEEVYGRGNYWQKQGKMVSVKTLDKSYKHLLTGSGDARLRAQLEELDKLRRHRYKKLKTLDHDVDEGLCKTGRPALVNLSQRFKDIKATESIGRRGTKRPSCT